MTDAFQEVFRTNARPFEAEGTPEQEMDHVAGMVANVITSSHFFEVVELSVSAQYSPAEVRLWGRVKFENEKMFIAEVVKPLLRASKPEKDFNADISKLYVEREDIRSPGGYAVLYGWRLVFSSSNAATILKEVGASVMTLSPQHHQVVEIPMLGAGPPAGNGPMGGRRGVTPVRG
jgi:hypothetical protein